MCRFRTTSDYNPGLSWSSQVCEPRANTETSNSNSESPSFSSSNNIHDRTALPDWWLVSANRTALLRFSSRLAGFPYDTLHHWRSCSTRTEYWTEERQCFSVISFTSMSQWDCFEQSLFVLCKHPRHWLQCIGRSLWNELLEQIKLASNLELFCSS